MGWKKEVKLEKLESIKDGLQKVVESEVKKTEERMKNFVMICEIKAKHEKRKKDALGTETNTSTTD